MSVSSPEDDSRDSLRDIVEDLKEIQSEAGDRELREELEETIEQVRDLDLTPTVFGQVIRKYTGRDIGEAIVGAVIFSLPLLVEDGVFDIAEFFLQHTLFGVPYLLVLNGLFVITIPLAILYWADFQQVVPSRPVFGLIPRRLLGVVVISFLTATGLMALWGRLGSGEEPVVMLARISIVMTAGALGASLGDILPGQSVGPDISETLENVADRMGLD